MRCGKHVCHSSYFHVDLQRWWEVLLGSCLQKSHSQHVWLIVWICITLHAFHNRITQHILQIYTLMCFSLTHLVAWPVPHTLTLTIARSHQTVERSGLIRHICRPPLCLPKEPIRFHTSVKTSLLAGYWIMLYARFFKCFRSFYLSQYLVLCRCMVCWLWTYNHKDSVCVYCLQWNVLSARRFCPYVFQTK